jgi:hypothetical protein
MLGDNEELVELVSIVGQDFRESVDQVRKINRLQA